MTKTQDLTVAEALARILAAVSVLETEEVAILESLGRVIAQDVVAKDSMPPFDNSSMDGFALIGSETANASEETPLTLNVIGDIAAGSWPDFTLTAGTAARIMTGAPIPQGATAVVPVEGTNEGWKNRERPLPDAVEVYRSVKDGDYIRPKGDDIQTGDTILKTGHVIRPQEIGVMAALGVATVRVVRRPKVAVLSTGDELLDVDAELTPGKIRNSNSYAIAAQVMALGAEPLRLGTALDTEEDVRAKLQAGLDAGVDLFISTAGVSVGAYDVVKAVLDDQGDVDFWRVKMRPGKPLAVGTYQGVPYMGLPGNPVSAMVSFERFTRAAIMKMAGRTALDHRQVTATLLEDLKSDGRESYIRVRLNAGDDGYTAQPTGEQGSHMMTSLVQANGLLILPLGTTFAVAGETFSVLILE